MVDKSRGIIIEFDQEITNTPQELEKNKRAFTITSDEEKYIASNETEIKTHEIQSIEFDSYKEKHKINLNNPTFNDLDISGNSMTLGRGSD